MLLLFLSILSVSAPVQTEPVNLIRSGDSGVEVRISVPEPVFLQELNGWYPGLEEAGVSSKAGDFLRPSYSFCIPVPAGSVPDLDYSINEYRHIDSAPPEWARVPELHGTGLDTREVIPASPAPRSINPVEVSVMQLAGTEMAVVSVFPFHGSSLSDYASEITVTLRWPETSGRRSCEGTLAELIALPGTGFWPLQPERGRESPFWGRPWARISIQNTGFYSISGQDLIDAGIDAVGAPSASLSMHTGPGRQFKLYVPEEEHELSEIAVLVDDGNDGIFDAADSIMFFAQALNRFETTSEGDIERLHHRYAVNNVYWLTWGGGNGLRMDSLQVTPDGAPAWGDSLDHRIWLEEEIMWVPMKETTTGWVWSPLFINTPGYFYFPSPSPEGPGQITVSVVCEKIGNHRIQFFMGSDLIADTTWGTSGEAILLIDDVEMDESINQMKMVLIESNGNVYLNYLSVVYPRSLSYGVGREFLFPGSPWERFTFAIGGAEENTGSQYDGCLLFDTSDPFRPIRLSGPSMTEGVLEFSHDITSQSRLMAINPEHWKEPDSIRSASPGRIIGSLNPSDVAVVAAEKFMDGVHPIEVLYELRGRTTAIVSGSEVYSEFGQGVRDPGAIRSFFRFTQDNWEPQAEALLLVGDGNYDPLGHVTSEQCLLPVCIHIAGIEFGKDFLIEDTYVMAHEGGYLPEVPISRISVDSEHELAGYVAKLLKYQEGSTAGEWSNRALFIADDEWAESNMTDEIQHVLACELFADSIMPIGMDRRKFYLIEYPWPAGTSPEGIHPEKPQARQYLISLLPQGFSSMIFFGHGSYGQIAHEKLLISSDIDLINNGARLPLSCFATCDVGHFDLISTDCMSEQFFLKPDGGSITTIAATRGTTSTANRNMFGTVYDCLYNSDSYSVGQALWVGKIINPGTGRNCLNVVLGDGGVCLLKPEGPTLSVDLAGDDIHRGSVNTASIDFQENTTGWFRTTESGAYTTYTCLLNETEITYLKYGGTAFTGMIESGSSGIADIDFFMPLQADTGSYGRCSMVGLTGISLRAAAREWIDVIDTGEYSPDSTGPVIDLMVNNLREEDQPEIWGTVTLGATLSDESGICILGETAGRAILMSLDLQGFDLSSCFTFRPGSYTTGDLEFVLPELLEGSHRVILAAWDGLGNGVQDTLDFKVVRAPSELIGNVFIYPNPGRGQRVFCFQAIEDGTVGISVYTVAGRRIWRTTSQCRQGCNQVLWDGRDQDGDLPGSGVYIYRIEYYSQSAGSFNCTDVLAVTGE